MRISGEQAEGLEARLGVPVRVAARLWHPYPAEVLPELSEAGVEHIVSVPLAPQSVHVYEASVREAAEAKGMRVTTAPPWGEEPALIEAFAETIDAALADLRPDTSERVPIVLSAHSLPQRIIDAGDPYEVQFRAMAARVARRYEAVGHVVRVAFQSQGATSDPWLGPDLPTTFADLVERGFDAVVVAPIGFVAEHVETLYDLDVEAPKVARAAGLHRFGRASAVGASSLVIDALEAVSRRMLPS